ncbi:MAG: hypothetical protein FWF11_05240 [Coriobacteriia bacterium]|nr:hypothetical protein [Coriobacteriia bacterium]
MTRPILRLLNLLFVFVVMLAAGGLLIYGVLHLYRSWTEGDPMIVFGVLFILLGAFLLWGMAKHVCTLTGLGKGRSDCQNSEQ